MAGAAGAARVAGAAREGAGAGGHASSWMPTWGVGGVVGGLELEVWRLCVEGFGGPWCGACVRAHGRLGRWQRG